MCDNDLVALLDQVYNGFGCHFHSRHLFRKGIAQGIAAQSDNDFLFLHSKNPLFLQLTF